MRFFTIIGISLIILSCSSAKKIYSTPEDSSRNLDPLFTQKEIDKRLDNSSLDKHLSRFYSSPNSPHVAAIPITGALIDSIAFLRTDKADYNKFEYKKVSNSYRAFLFNKVSCFFTFIKGTAEQANIGNYEISVKNLDGSEFTAKVKSEQEHLAFLTILNTMFPKTYVKNKPRSIEVSSLYSQDLICSDKIDFTKPFTVKFKYKDTTIDLLWL